MQLRKLPKFEFFDSLIQNDRVSDFMTTSPIVLYEDNTMADAKASMRDHRISGIPIVDREGHLVGLVSIENIIIALENHQMGEPIKKHMVRDVVSLKDDMNITSVIEYFMSYNYGRYPVIDDDGVVVGIVTNGDVILHILKRLGTVYMHNKRRDEILTPTKYLLYPEKFVHENCFTYVIDSEDYERAGEGSMLMKRYLIEKGLPPEVIRRASIALYEAEVNVVIHAHGKGEIKAYVEDEQIYILVTDSGPGIEDVELAMRPGFSTASEKIREKGWGAGMGLPNIKKYTDKMIILSSSNGVKLEMTLLNTNVGPEKNCINLASKRKRSTDDDDSSTSN